VDAVRPGIEASEYTYARFTACRQTGHQRGIVADGALPGVAPTAIFPTMFTVTEADATAIRAVYEQDGELSAAMESMRMSGVSGASRPDGR